MSSDYATHDTERFYLRLLLNHVQGATCFEDVKIVNGIYYDTYEEAARQCGLLDEQNNEIDNCLKEAVNYKMPSKLRQLFASILLFCNHEENFKPEILLEKYIMDLSKDYYFQKINEVGPINVDINNHNWKIIRTKTLANIEKYLLPYGKTLADFNIIRSDYSLIEDENEFQQQTLIREETNYDQDEMKTLLTKKNLLNDGQKEIYNTVINAVNNKSNQKIFFVDGPGGYGKTFLFNIMLAEVRLQNQIAIAVASSGIAALLLNGGRTAHSRFKIPIPIIETSTLNISKNSELADLIRMAKLIIWDEAPMAHRYTFEAVDRTFKDLTDNSDEPFGGKIIVMGGDFRQILPVVIRGTRAHIINACIKSSNLWRFVKVMHLTENMRVQDAMQKQFVDYLLKIGEEKETIHENIGEDIIQLPNEIIFNENDTIVSFISKIFYNLNENYSNDQTYVDYIKDRAILTPKNEDVDSINEQIINIFSEEAKEFLSADSVEDKDEVHLGLYPIEFLNTLTPSGTPPHRLILKKGVSIILLRNLSPTEGLCNGTRLIVREFNKHMIDTEILTGSHLGKRVFIPRISITPSDTELPLLGNYSVTWF